MKAAVVFLSLVLSISAAPKDGRIIGGEETTIEKYPALAQLDYLNGLWSQSCGANILTSRWVVSAAHCFHTVSPIYRRIRAGSSIVNSGGTVVAIERFIRHPEYRESQFFFDFDIALAYLAEALVFGDTIQPASILAQGTEIPDNAVITYAGWGWSFIGGTFFIQVREVDVYSINREFCKERYTSHPQQWYYNFEITDNMLCGGIMGEGGKDACNGDSGGPAYYLNILVGVVSWGATCADEVYPGVNTRVSAFTDWILATVTAG